MPARALSTFSSDSVAFWLLARGMMNKIVMWTRFNLYYCRLIKPLVSLHPGVPYLKAPPLAVSTQNALSFDLIAWWRANETVYPTLARMAYELYSIPSMSAEVERVFSRFDFEKSYIDVKCQVNLERPSKSTVDRISGIGGVFA